MGGPPARNLGVLCTCEDSALRPLNQCACAVETLRLGVGDAATAVACVDALLEERAVSQEALGVVNALVMTTVYARVQII